MPIASQLQLRRGTTPQHAVFTGAPGEVTVDTDKKTVVVHDGSTAGGFPHALENDPRIVGAAQKSANLSDLASASTARANLDLEVGVDVAAFNDSRITGALPAATAGTGSVLASGSTTARTLSNRFADAVNVKDYGVAGDGVTNDQPAIQALLDSKDAIYFPEGTYAIFNAPETAPIVTQSRACLTVHRNGSRIILHPKAVLKHTWTGTFSGRRFVDIRASDVVWDGGVLDGSYDFAGQGTSAVMNGPTGTERNAQLWFRHTGLTINDQSYSSILAGKWMDGANKPTLDDHITIDGIHVKNLTIKNFRFNGHLIEAYAFYSGAYLRPTRRKGFRNITFENVVAEKNIWGCGIDAADQELNTLWTRLDYPPLPLTSDSRKPLENIRFLNCRFGETGRVDNATSNGGNCAGCGGFVNGLLYDNCVFEHGGRMGFEMGGSEVLNVTFRKCHFKNGYYRTLSVGGTNITIEGCYIYDSWSFHEIFCRNLVFKGNHVEGLINVFAGSSTKNRAEAMTFENNYITSLDENKTVLDPDRTRMIYAATGDATTNVITAIGHAFTNGTRVRFATLNGGSGVNDTTAYFVRDVAGSTFKLALTSAGSAVSIGSDITAATIVRVGRSRGSVSVWNGTNIRYINNIIVNVHSTEAASALFLQGCSQCEMSHNLVTTISPSPVAFISAVNCSDLVIRNNHYNMVNFDPAVVLNIRTSISGVRRLLFDGNTRDCYHEKQVFISNASPGVVSWNAHPLNNGDVVRFSRAGAFFPTGNLPTQIVSGREYYVVNKGTNDFQIAATPSGTPINTSGGSGSTYYVTAWGFTKQVIAVGGFGFSSGTNHKKRTWSGSAWTEDPITLNSTVADVRATSSIVGNGTTATVTTTTNHGLPSGTSLVNITNAVDAGFNGRHTVTNTGANTFTFASAINATASVQGNVYPVRYGASNTPSPFPANGEIYVTGDDPTGAWAGYAAHFATWNGSWSFAPISNVSLYTLSTTDLDGYMVVPQQGPTYDTGLPVPFAGECWLHTEGGLVDSIIRNNVFTNNGRITYQIEGGALSPFSPIFGDVFWNCTFEGNDAMPRTNGLGGTTNFFFCKAIGRPSRTMPTYFSIKGAFVPNLTNTGGWRNNRGSQSNAWDAEPVTGAATYDPPSLNDGAGDTATVTATGAALGDFATASFSEPLQGITVSAWVSAANTVSVRFQNESGGVVDLASGTLRVRVIKP